MNIDNKGLPERFFSLFPGMNTREIVACLYPEAKYETKQPQLSRWRKGKEPIPLAAMDRALELHPEVSWDWLLTGGRHRSPRVLQDDGQGVVSVAAAIDRLAELQQYVAGVTRYLSQNPEQTFRAADFAPLEAAFESLEALWPVD